MLSWITPEVQLELPLWIPSQVAFWMLKIIPLIIYPRSSPVMLMEVYQHHCRGILSTFFEWVPINIPRRNYNFNRNLSIIFFKSLSRNYIPSWMSFRGLHYTIYRESLCMFIQEFYIHLSSFRNFPKVNARGTFRSFHRKYLRSFLRDLFHFFWIHASTHFSNIVLQIPLGISNDISLFIFA